MTLNMNKKSFTEEDIKKDKNAIIYDPTGGDDTPNLPDTKTIADNVERILEYMVSKPDVMELKNKNYNEYEKHMENMFPVFSSRYMGIFSKIINGEDITPLFEMLKKIDEIKKGNTTLEKVEKKLGENLAEKYIYPNLTAEQRRNVKNTLKNKKFK